MKLPAKKYRDYADHVISIMQAFKQGRSLQRKGKNLTYGEWEDFDLESFIDGGPIEYRIKPETKEII